MTNTNYGSAQLSDTKQKSEMEGLLGYVVEKNERFIKLIQRLDNVSHRLKDTNFPAKEKEIGGDKIKPLGLLFEIGEQIERYNTQCNRLEEIVQKFESII